MPEAPEIEILRAQLSSAVFGKKIRRIDMRAKGSSSLPARTPHLVRNAAVVGVERFGKLLVLHLDVGLSLVIHLMMAGQLRLLRTATCREDATELILYFDEQLLALSCVSLRHVHLLPTQGLRRFSSIANLGVDVFSPEFTCKLLCDALEGGRGTIKQFLLKQRHVAGLGNMYVDEILFSAGIDPRSTVSKLPARSIRLLFEAIKKELHKGLALGGCSEMNWVDLYGRAGKYHRQCQVKHRKGKPCLRCNVPIEYDIVGGRGSYYCPRCQKRV